MEAKMMQEFYKAVHNFLIYASSRYIAANDNTFSRELEQWTSVLKKLNPIIKEMKANARAAFINEYRGEILFTYQAIVGKLAALYFGKEKIMAIRRLYDQFIGSLNLRKKPTEYYEHIATRIFLMFCDGVFFTTANLDLSQTPAYHRTGSCGSKFLNLTNRLAPRNTNSASNAMNKKARARTCLIERLLYDAIYKAAFYEQNTGHGYELLRTQQLYDAYYPSHDLRIDVVFTKIIYPVSITVRTINKRTQHEMQEVFKRELVSAEDIAYGPVTYNVRSF